MDVLLSAFGCISGFALGWFLVFLDSLSQQRTRALFEHMRHLGFFCATYLAIFGYCILFRLPNIFSALAIGMAILEITMYFFGARLKKRLGK